MFTPSAQKKKQTNISILSLHAATIPFPSPAPVPRRSPALVTRLRAPGFNHGWSLVPWGIEVIEATFTWGFNHGFNHGFNRGFN